MMQKNDAPLFMHSTLVLTHAPRTMYATAHTVRANTASTTVVVSRASRVVNRVARPHATTHSRANMMMTRTQRPIMMMFRNAPRAPRRRHAPIVASSGENTVVASSSPVAVASAQTHLVASVGALFALDKTLEHALCVAGVTFPSALIGMFGILAALLVTEKIGGEDAASAMEGTVAPALNWITSWLPVFYVPSLVVTPLVVTKIAPSALAKVLGIVVVGFVTTIAFSATSANFIRKFTGTELLPVPPAKPAPPTEDYVYKLWMGVLAVSAISAVATGANAAKVVAMLSATVCSFLVGNLPDFKSKMNPIVTTSVLSNVAAAALGALTGDGWMKMLSLYRTGVPFGLETISGLGAGDILMTFLGSVILSFAFKVYGARKIIARHAVEIFGCLVSTSLFAMFSTAVAGKALGLSSALSAALVPRSVTVALAIPVTTLLGHPEMVSVTAVGVVLTGLIGSSLAVSILNKVGAKDPITRGLATAASAHGLGTAALVGGEPNALPYCALAYALSGIISSVLVAVPFIQAALLAIIGTA